MNHQKKALATLAFAVFSIVSSSENSPLRPTSSQGFFSVLYSEMLRVSCFRETRDYLRISGQGSSRQITALLRR